MMMETVRKYRSFMDEPTHAREELACKIARYVPGKPQNASRREALLHINMSPTHAILVRGSWRVRTDVPPGGSTHRSGPP